MSKFIKWWLEFCLILGGTYTAYSYGLLTMVFDNDITKLSYLILGLFFAFTALLGLDVFVKKVGDGLLYVGWFISEILLGLGMLGTVIGFIYMLSGSMGGMDTSDTETIKEALTIMASGMATALYTTAMGLITSLLLKVQLITLENPNVSGKE
jgi:hypothetical protein